MKPLVSGIKKMLDKKIWTKTDQKLFTDSIKDYSVKLVWNYSIQVHNSRRIYMERYIVLCWEKI